MSTRPTIFERNPLPGSLGWGALVAITAAILSLSIARENWVLLFALAALTAVVLWPVEIALGTFVLLIPFDFVALGGGNAAGVTLNWYIGAAAGPILLATGLLQRRLILPPRAALWWSLFILWASATALWALDPQTTLRRLPTALALLLLYLAAVSVKVSPKELTRISYFVIAGGVAAFAMQLLQRGTGFSDRATLAIGSAVANPNDFAATLLLPVSLAIGGFLSARGPVRKLAWLAIVSAIMLSLLLTMSRGALVAMFVLIFVYVYRFRRSYRAFVPAAALFLALLLASPTFLARVENSIASRAQGRFDLWQVGLAALRHYGVQGAGLDNFPYAYDKYVSAASFFRGFDRAPHNAFLGAAVELGIVGLGLFMVAVRSQLRAALTSKQGAGGKPFPATLPYEAGCWGMLAMGLSLDNLWLKAFWCAWILLALSVRVTAERPQSSAV